MFSVTLPIVSEMHGKALIRLFSMPQTWYSKTFLEVLRYLVIQLDVDILQVSNSSDEPIGEDPEKVGIYLNERMDCLISIDKNIKIARKFIRRMSGEQKETLKETLKKLDELDHNVIIEWAALKNDRAHLRNYLLSQPSYVGIHYAYRDAINDWNWWREKKIRVSKHVTSSFQTRLIKAYNTYGSEIIASPFLYFTAGIWCPVVGMEWRLSAMRAFQIISHHIGNTTAAYLFGKSLNEGHSVLWSEANGLMVFSSFPPALLKDEMTIVPDPDDNRECMSFIFSEQLLTQILWRAIHQKTAGV